MIATLTPLHKNVPHLTDNEHLMLKVDVPKTYKDLQTVPPKHICFVLDTSGSMTAVFPTLIKSVKSGLSKLRDEDSISVICYNSKVTILCEWNKCTEALKKSLEERLNGLQCNGSTNISGALFQAIGQSMKVPKSTAVTTICMTDGLANEGVTDINNLAVMLKKVIPTNTTIHSLGFDVGHNPIFLKAVADVCNKGLYFFVENDDILKGSFVEIIGKTMEVAYQNVKLTLDALHTNFSDFQTGKDFKTLPLGDLHLGETRRWIIESKFIDNASKYEIRGQLHGFNVMDVQHEIVYADVVLERGDDYTVDENVAKKINLVSASKAVKLATTFAQKKQYGRAEKLLRATSQNLRGLPVIQEGLNNLARGLSDDSNILNISSHRMTSYQQALETDGDSVFQGTPGKGLWISPIRTPQKNTEGNTFYPSDDEEVTAQIVPLCSTAPQAPLAPPNLVRAPRSELSSTAGQKEEE